MKALLFIFIVFSHSLWANEPDSSKSVFQYGFGLHQGFVLVHSQDVRNVKDSYPNGIQIDLSWHQRSKASFNHVVIQKMVKVDQKSCKKTRQRTAQRIQPH